MKNSKLLLLLLTLVTAGCIQNSFSMKLTFVFTGKNKIEVLNKKTKITEIQADRSKKITTIQNTKNIITITYQDGSESKTYLPTCVICHDFLKVSKPILTHITCSQCKRKKKMLGNHFLLEACRIKNKKMLKLLDEKNSVHQAARKNRDAYIRVAKLIRMGARISDSYLDRPATETTLLAEMLNEYTENYPRTG